MVLEYSRTSHYVENNICNILCLHMVSFGSLRETHHCPWRNLSLVGKQVGGGDCLRLIIQQLKELTSPLA